MATFWRGDIRAIGQIMNGILALVVAVLARIDVGISINCRITCCWIKNELTVIRWVLELVDATVRQPEADIVTILVLSWIASFFIIQLVASGPLRRTCGAEEDV